jgi:hypothetical protein
MTKLQVLQEKLDNAFKKNGPNAKDSIIQLMQRNELSHDSVVPLKEVLFDGGNGFHAIYNEKGSDDGTVVTMHKNAVEQTAQTLELPSSYIAELATGKDWMPKLAAININTTIEHTVTDKRVLLRMVGDECRAVLSDKYRRMNMPVILGTFANEAKNVGAMLFDGYCGDLRSHLEVLLPRIEVVETENNGDLYMAFGMQISSSDFGQGALDLRLFNYQVICGNGKTLQSVLRKVHLGARIKDDFEFSQRTYDLDTQTVSSMVGDIVRKFLSAETVQQQINRMKKDSTITVNMEERIKHLPKMGMSKEEQTMLSELLYESDADKGITGANTLLKLKEGVSWVANVVPIERKRELQLIAGQLA